LKYSADTLNLSVAVTHPVEKIQQNTYNNNWAASQQNQRDAFATSMDSDQPAHQRSVIRIHVVRLQTL
jgi:hypothetical protein